MMTYYIITRTPYGKGAKEYLRAPNSLNEWTRHRDEASEFAEPRAIQLYSQLKIHMQFDYKIALGKVREITFV